MSKKGYVIMFKGWGYVVCRRVKAASRSQAKYKAFLKFKACYCFLDFMDFVKNLTVKEVKNERKKTD